MKPFERATLIYNKDKMYDIARTTNTPFKVIKRLTLHGAKEIWKNDIYQVSVLRYDNEGKEVDEGGNLIHLSIKRIDREVIHDWRDLQEIKNMLVGEECEGVEIYPAESRRADSSNQYHLYVFNDPNYRIPFGFKGRMVSELEPGGSKQRPFDEDYKAKHEVIE